MSYAAEKWAREQKTGNARAKAVLLELANCLNSETGKCCPSLDHICEVTELQRHTVISAIKFLVEKGFIEKTLITTRKGRSSQYRLLGFTDSVNSDTMGSVETDTTHGEHSVNSDTMGSVKFNTTDSVNSDTMGSVKFNTTDSVNSDTMGSVETDTTHGEHSVNSDTMGSVKFNTTDSVKNDTRTSNKNKEIEHINTIRENSPSDDFSLEPTSEKEEQKINPPETLDCPYEAIANAYNEILGQYLGICRKLTSTRKRNIKARWNECIKDKDFDTLQGGIDCFREYFDYIKQCDFLIGKTGHFRASFDWIFTEGNYTKICERRYENRPLSNNYQR